MSVVEDPAADPEEDPPEEDRQRQHRQPAEQQDGVVADPVLVHEQAADVPFLCLLPECPAGEVEFEQQQRQRRDLLEERRVLRVEAEIGARQVRVAAGQVDRLVAGLGRLADEHQALDDEDREEPQGGRHGARRCQKSAHAGPMLPSGA
jgi:hypothetical protein